MGEALLAPHRWYGLALLPLVETNRVHALAHVTGGGIAGNLVRVLPQGCRARLAADAWPRPALFRWLIETGQVPEDVKEERWEMLMGVQRAVSSHVLAARIGQTIDVLVDDVDEEGAIARSAWDAPEIDGCVFLNGATDLQIGDKVRARVMHADEYDLWADVV